MNVALPEIDGRIITPRRLVQGSGRARSRSPRPTSPPMCRSPTASPSSPISRATGRGCARTPPAERRIVAGACQLSQPRRPHRQWRRPRHAGRDGRRAARACRRRVIASPTSPPTATRSSRGSLAGSDQRRARPPRRRDFPARRLRALLSRRCRARRRTRSMRAGARPSAIRSSAQAELDCGALRHAGAALRQCRRRGAAGARLRHRSRSRRYHDPDLPPPHGYLAFYAWIADGVRAHAVVHMGKHGNLEWLPGKAVALVGGMLPRGGAGRRCRISIPSSSTIRARARRPSAAPRP